MCGSVVEIMSHRRFSNGFCWYNSSRRRCRGEVESDDADDAGNCNEVDIEGAEVEEGRRLHDVRQAQGALRGGAKSQARPAASAKSLQHVPYCNTRGGRHQGAVCPNVYAKYDANFSSARAERNQARCTQEGGRARRVAWARPGRTEERSGVERWRPRA